MKTFLRKFESMPMSFGMFTRGWGCGYVVLPQGHPYHGKTWEELPFDVHGGITFSQFAPDWAEDFDFNEDEWVIGFDTAHYGDTMETCPKEYVVEQTEYLRKQCEEVLNETQQG